MFLKSLYLVQCLKKRNRQECEFPPENSQDIQPCNMFWDSFSFHIPTDQCRITKRCKEETQNYKEHKVLCWGLWMTHRVSARGSCLQHRKRVTWLSKRISDWQLSWEIHTPIGTYVSLLDTAIKPEIFRFLEHVVFGLWLGIKGKVFLILFEQGYECWRPPHSSFTPFRPLLEKDGSWETPNFSGVIHMKPREKLEGS